MIRKLYHSFVPYVILLIGIFTAVIILDRFAAQISEQPNIIHISHGNISESEDILSFELNENPEDDNLSPILKDSLFLKGRSQYRQKHFDQAEQTFELLRAQYPGNKSLLNYLGLTALKKKEFLKAKDYFIASVGIDSSYFTGYMNLALTCTKLNQLKTAKGYYQKAREINQNHPKVRFNLGLLYTKLQDWGEAQTEFENCITLSSGAQKAKGFCYLGIMQINIGDTLSARNNLQSAVEYRPDYQLPRIHLALINTDGLIREQELLKIYSLNPNSYYANYYLGIQFNENNNFQKAEYHLKKALRFNPDDEKVIEAISSFLINQTRYDEASRIISGFAVSDTLPQSYFQQGRNAAKQGKIEEAIALYDRALLKSGWDYPEAYLNQAILFKRNGDLTRAINNYTMAIEGRNNYTGAYYNLAVLYKETDQLSKAIEMYLQAIKYDKRSYKSWYNLGSIYSELHDTIQAIDAYKHAIDIKPDYLLALSSLGILYSRLNEYDQAIAIYTDLLERHPHYSRGWYNIGLAYNKSGMLNEAIHAYERLLEIAPENTKALINIGVLYARTKQLNKSIKAFESAADLEIDNPVIRFNLALQYEKTDRMVDATYQYQKATQLDRDYTKAHNNLVELYYTQGDTAMAYIATYNRLLSSPDAEKFYALGKELLDVGKPEYAQASFQNSKALGKEGAWVDYWIGKAYLDQGSYDNAITNLVKTLSEDPEHQFAYYRLGQTYELVGDTATANTYYRQLLRLRPDFKIVHKSKKI